jgi:hypothetical protein
MREIRIPVPDDHEAEARDPLIDAEFDDWLFAQLPGPLSTSIAVC